MQLSYDGDDENHLDLQKKIKRMIPTQIQDIIATAILLIFFPLGILLHFFYVLPTWFPAFEEAWILRVVPITFLVFNLYSNWVMMLKVGPSGKSAILPNIVKPGYRFCHSCRVNSPPRAYHCPVCDICVLRRDHHCSFGGVCVGHFNQRYFVAAVINLLCLTIPLVSYAWSLLNIKFENGVSFGNIWQVMLPHLAWVFGFITIYQFLHVLLFVLTFTVAFFGFYLAAAQAFCIYKGQTRPEYLMDVHAFQLGFIENLKQSLGTHGQSFVTREMYNIHTKDL
ncbi:unnamed protein product [Caenorhabditis sp. 36 PRJEB53466]|nr:unnamed protein product [Caenorhabditis sp. 36 PRJEB53466]